MVSRGLKEGDVFEDGGLFYRVDKVVGNNYVSHRIPKPLSGEQPENTEQAQPETEIEDEEAVTNVGKEKTGSRKGSRRGR